MRQDERVMQLFGLVNTLLLSDPETFRRNLTIQVGLTVFNSLQSDFHLTYTLQQSYIAHLLCLQRYAVIPLSTNSGLIGWVPRTDTLHTLIHDYREKKKILLNIEHRIMLRMAPDYDVIFNRLIITIFEQELLFLHPFTIYYNFVWNSTSH